MDQQRDFEPFKRLVSRLCVTFDKFANDELIESWWKALRTEPYTAIERAVDLYIARADGTTKFPRPGQFASVRATNFDPKSEAKDRRMCEDNQHNWRAFIDRFPKTGPIRAAMSRCAQILATEHERSPAHAEAFSEYLHLENQLGQSGRFSADA